MHTHGFLKKFCSFFLALLMLCPSSELLGSSSSFEKCLAPRSNLSAQSETLPNKTPPLKNASFHEQIHPSKQNSLQSLEVIIGELKELSLHKKRNREEIEQLLKSITREGKKLFEEDHIYQILLLSGNKKLNERLDLLPYLFELKEGDRYFFDGLAIAKIFDSPKNNVEVEPCVSYFYDIGIKESSRICNIIGSSITLDQIKKLKSAIDIMKIENIIKEYGSDNKGQLSFYEKIFKKNEIKKMPLNILYSLLPEEIKKKTKWNKLIRNYSNAKILVNIWIDSSNKIAVGDQRFDLKKYEYYPGLVKFIEKLKKSKGLSPKKAALQYLSSIPLGVRKKLHWIYVPTELERPELMPGSKDTTKNELKKIIAELNTLLVKKEEKIEAIKTSLAKVKREGKEFFNNNQINQLLRLSSAKLQERLLLLPDLFLLKEGDGYIFNGSNISVIFLSKKTNTDVRDFIDYLFLPDVNITNGYHISQIISSSKDLATVKSFIPYLQGIEITNGYHISQIINSSKDLATVKSFIPYLQGIGITDSSTISDIIHSSKSLFDVATLFSYLSEIGITDHYCIKEIISSSITLVQIKKLRKAIDEMKNTINKYDLDNKGQLTFYEKVFEEENEIKKIRLDILFLLLPAETKEQTKKKWNALVHNYSDAKILVNIEIDEEKNEIVVGDKRFEVNTYEHYEGFYRFIKELQKESQNPKLLSSRLTPVKYFSNIPLKVKETLKWTFTPIQTQMNMLVDPLAIISIIKQVWETNSWGTMVMGIGLAVSIFNGYGLLIVGVLILASVFFLLDIKLSQGKKTFSQWMPQVSFVAIFLFASLLLFFAKPVYAVMQASVLKPSSLALNAITPTQATLIVQNAMHLSDENVLQVLDDFMKSFSAKENKPLIISYDSKTTAEQTIIKIFETYYHHTQQLKTIIQPNELKAFLNRMFPNCAITFINQDGQDIIQSIFILPENDVSTEAPSVPKESDKSVPEIPQMSEGFEQNTGIELAELVQDPEQMLNLWLNNPSQWTAEILQKYPESLSAMLKHNFDRTLELILVKPYTTVTQILLDLGEHSPEDATHIIEALISGGKHHDPHIIEQLFQTVIENNSEPSWIKNLSIPRIEHYKNSARLELWGEKNSAYEKARKNIEEFQKRIDEGQVYTREEGNENSILYGLTSALAYSLKNLARLSEQNRSNLPDETIFDPKAHYLTYKETLNQQYALISSGANSVDDFVHLAEDFIQLDPTSNEVDQIYQMAQSAVLDPNVEIMGTPDTAAAVFSEMFYERWKSTGDPDMLSKVMQYHEKIKQPKNLFLASEKEFYQKIKNLGLKQWNPSNPFQRYFRTEFPVWNLKEMFSTKINDQVMAADPSHFTRKPRFVLFSIKNLKERYGNTLRIMNVPIGNDHVLIDPLTPFNLRSLNKDESMVLGPDSPGRFTISDTVLPEYVLITRLGKIFYIEDLSPNNDTSKFSDVFLKTLEQITSLHKELQLLAGGKNTLKKTDLIEITNIVSSFSKSPNHKALKKAGKELSRFFPRKNISDIWKAICTILDRNSSPTSLVNAPTNKEHWLAA